MKYYLSHMLSTCPILLHSCLYENFAIYSLQLLFDYLIWAMRGDSYDLLILSGNFNIHDGWWKMTAEERGDQLFVNFFPLPLWSCSFLHCVIQPYQLLSSTCTLTLPLCPSSKAQTWLSSLFDIFTYVRNVWLLIFYEQRVGRTAKYRLKILLCKQFSSLGSINVSAPKPFSDSFNLKIQKK